MELVLDRHQLVLHLAADERIERAEGFVHEQDVGVGRQCAGQPYPLLHAAAELAGIAPLVAAEPDEGQGPLGGRIATLDVHAFHLEPERDVGADVLVGEQGEVLEDHAGAVATEGLQLLGVERGDVGGVDQDGAGGRFVQPVHAADQG